MMKSLTSKLVVLMGLLTLSVPAFAEAPVTPQDTIAAQETTVTVGTLMLAAYLALWFMLMAYMLVLAVRQTRLDEDIDSLEKRLDEILDVPEAQS